MNDRHRRVERLRQEELLRKIKRHETEMPTIENAVKGIKRALAAGFRGIGKSFGYLADKLEAEPETLSDIEVEIKARLKND